MENELENIVYGSSFFGGGGGGSAEEGHALLKKMIQEDPNAKVHMIEVNEMEENAVATMVAALGSPVATKGKLFEEEAQNAIRGMAEEAARQGKSLKYVYSGEQGGGNTMLPIYAAWKLGLPIINTDGNGRAVPELNTGLAPVYQIPTSPVVLASETGDLLVGKTADPLDSSSCEKIARYMCQAYDMGIGFSAWMMDREDLQKASAVGQMDITAGVGEILKKGKPDSVLGDLKDFFHQKEIPFKVIAEGTIKKIEIDVEGGFDTGVTTIEDVSGNEYKVLFQNENLAAYGPDGQTEVTVPGVISMILFDGENCCAVSNSETAEGMHVAVTATAADPRWDAVPEGFGCWKDVLSSAGYEGAEVRI